MNSPLSQDPDHPYYRVSINKYRICIEFLSSPGQFVDQPFDLFWDVRRSLTFQSTLQERCKLLTDKFSFWRLLRSHLFVCTCKRAALETADLFRTVPGRTSESSTLEHLLEVFVEGLAFLLVLELAEGGLRREVAFLWRDMRRVWSWCSGSKMTRQTWKTKHFNLHFCTLITFYFQSKTFEDYISG